MKLVNILWVSIKVLLKVSCVVGHIKTKGAVSIICLSHKVQMLELLAPIFKILETVSNIQNAISSVLIERQKWPTTQNGMTN